MANEKKYTTDNEGLRLRNFDIFGLKVGFPSGMDLSKAAIQRLSIDASKELSKKNEGLPVETNTGQEDFLGRGTGGVKERYSGVDRDPFSISESPNLANVKELEGEVGSAEQKFLYDSTSVINTALADYNYKLKYIQDNENLLTNNPIYKTLLNNLSSSNLTDAQKVDAKFAQISLLANADSESTVQNKKTSDASSTYDKNLNKVKAFVLNPATSKGGMFSGLLGTEAYNPVAALTHGLLYEGIPGKDTYGKEVTPDKSANPNYTRTNQIAVKDKDGNIKYQEVKTEIDNPYKGKEYLNSAVVIKNPMNLSAGMGKDGIEVSGSDMEFEDINNYSLASLNHKINIGDLSEAEALDILKLRIRRSIFTGDGGENYNPLVQEQTGLNVTTNIDRGLNAELLGAAGLDGNITAIAESMLNQSRQIIDARIEAGYERYVAAIKKTDGDASPLSMEQYRLLHDKEMSEFFEAGDTFTAYKREEDQKYLQQLYRADTGENVGYVLNDISNVLQQYGLGENLSERLGAPVMQVIEQVVTSEHHSEVINTLVTVLKDGISNGGEISEEQVNKDIETILKKVLGTKQYASLNALKTKLSTDFGRKDPTYQPFNGGAKLANSVNYSLEETTRKELYDELNNMTKDQRKKTLQKIHPSLGGDSKLLATVDKLTKQAYSTMTASSGTSVLEETADDIEMNLDTDVTDELADVDITTIATVMSAQIPELGALGIDTVSYLSEFLSENNIDAKFLPDILDRIEYT